MAPESTAPAPQARTALAPEIIPDDAPRVVGRVVRFGAPGKGYAFARAADGSEAFVHASTCEGMLWVRIERKRVEVVSYVAQTVAQGLRAFRVRAATAEETEQLAHAEEHAVDDGTDEGIGNR